MKWYNSILTKISLIFLLAIVGICTVLFLFAVHERQKELGNMERFARFAIHSSFNKKSKTLDFQNLKTMGLIPIKNKQLKSKILAKYNFFITKHKSTTMMEQMMGRMIHLNIKAIAFKRNIYILLKQKNGENIIFSTPFKKEIFSTFLFPIIFILLVILLYIAIIRSILPLYSLRKKIKLFANGNYDIDCKSKNKDEIGILSNDFDSAVKKIKNLRDSRQLFLRNIMHELKTPIVKGKFVAEMSQEQNFKKILQNIFMRQENLIEEFSRIEKLSANELKISKQEYLIEDLVDFAIDLLNHDINQTEKHITSVKIFVDFELFGTALKNLLDNGINYSEDKRVCISNDKEKIVISNIGKALEFPLERYCEPYFLEGKKQKSSRGLGFGLYIVCHVIKLHNMTIEYTREENKNLFTIKL